MCEHCDQPTNTKAWGIDTLRRVWGVITNAVQRRTSAPRIQDRAFRQYLNYYDKQITSLAQRLANGDITVAQWRNAMADEITKLHLTADVAGTGGLSNYTVNDLNRVQSHVDTQLEYLDNWVSDLRTQTEYNPDAIIARARLYGSNATSTVQGAFAAALGINDLPANPGDGTTNCLTNCRCKWDFKKLDGDGNWDCYWNLGIAEHCPTCKARSRIWSPLKIRNGKIESDIKSPALWRD